MKEEKGLVYFAEEMDILIFLESHWKFIMKILARKQKQKTCYVHMNCLEYQN